MLQLARRLLLFALLPGVVQAADMVDMRGNAVPLGGPVHKVLGASPPVTYMIYAIDPGLLAGWNQPPGEKLSRFLRPESASLPVVGGFGAGQGRESNIEGILHSKPDLVVAWAPESGRVPRRVEEALASFKTPCAYLNLDELTAYPSAFEKLGELVGRPERGRQLAAFYKAELSAQEAFARGIPDAKRVSVYFAQGPDGLTTVSSSSVHAEAVAFAGGKNVVTAESGDRRRKEIVSLEQIYGFGPEVIIADGKALADFIRSDPRWERLAAVRNGRVYVIPDAPFSWMDSPPSFLRLMGAKWLASVLYPQDYKVDVGAATKDFFKLFMQVDLSDGEIRQVLGR